MARINLLPWRAEERERRNKEFITLVVAVTLLTLLAAFATWSYFNNELEEQLDANALIEQENARLDTVLSEIDSLEQRREDIISRMQVIQDLQGRRPVPVRLWDDLAKAMPSALYLNNLKREGDVITLTGLADNPNVVSNLIRNLDSSKWMGNSAVSNIQQNISAYQAAPALNNTINTGEQTRPVYPEDSYVQFVVTTRVQSETATPEEGTGLGGAL
ncbi:PilN domain-containing protein [Psychrobacter celer]|uniref:PilN domain-containing protein n=1 Tax=Psychrobacter TaxID=497 RepID=UPI000946AAB6|nr:MULTISPECIES: PilN domain-containing protein [unclassified Psychrobacter]MDN5733534.1 PilN domain-containing protein [Psychrobacter sp.]OLF41665.1 pilus assembly protein PilS [Psychrobacter sp. Rd 27.2]PJX21487.1 pilus assembly protein PilS [Psychrobacter sp. L7]